MSGYNRRRPKAGRLSAQRWRWGLLLIVWAVGGEVMLGQSRNDTALLNSDVLTQLLREQESTVGSLAKCSNADSLQRLWSTLVVHDVVIDVVYWSRLWELSDSADAYEGILQTMPKNPLEFKYFYRMCTKPFDDQWLNARLNDVACEYFARAGIALLAEPAYLQDFLRLAIVVDGEIYNLYAGACVYVFEKKCVWFLEGLSRAHPSVELNVIGALELGLASRSCIEENISRVPSRYKNLFRPR